MFGSRCDCIRILSEFDFYPNDDFSTDTEFMLIIIMLCVYFKCHLFCAQCRYFVVVVSNSDGCG